MSDLDELKELLFGAERQVLHSIRDRVQIPEARAADIAAVLPEAVRISHATDKQLVETLKDPVVRVLRESFRESPQEFGDALYPVMGPAIRRSITHALKSFAQQINETLEYSLTLKGLSWRFRAARAGIPFASYIIQQSLQYRVEQVYLISRESGLLIGHVHHDSSRIKDSDAVSAMFTAIQDFVKESFSPDRDGRLETADMGEFMLWAVHGPHALLVCVIRGVPPQDLRSALSAVLERLHFRYGDAIRTYTGDTSSVAGIDDELRRCLRFEATRPEPGRRRKISWPLAILLTLLVASSAYLLWNRWQESGRYQQLAAAVDATPGLYIDGIRREGDAYVLSGLRDPLADSLAQIAERAGLPAGQLSGELRPFQSLDAPLRLQRAVKLFAPPDGIDISVRDGTLVLSGTASGVWLESALAKAGIVDTGWPVRFEVSRAIDWTELSAQTERLDGRRFYFSAGAEIVPADTTTLAEYAAALNALVRRAAAAGAAIAITVTGYTDGTGIAEYNDRLARSRAAVVVQALRDAGVAESRVRTVSNISASEPSTIDPTMRRAGVDVRLEIPEVSR